MPPSLLKRLPLYALSGILFLGAFSRFTHGVYTSAWYAYQEYHSPDDGSAVARIILVIDAIAALLIAGPSRKPRLYAAGFALVMFSIGLVMQVSAGKEYLGDVAHVAVAGAAVWGAL
ncbi:hypothetical protein BJY00DRAFT_112611 [Aspergillus carlsbadensis]|nr:hypothetical protein BJY00DRAFT_112611 [Aspergillus carlsbadensis]